VSRLPTKTVTIVRLDLGPEDALNYARLEGETKSLVRGMCVCRGSSNRAVLHKASITLRLELGAVVWWWCRCGC
jgi:hypothetical protein